MAERKQDDDHIIRIEIDIKTNNDCELDRLLEAYDGPTPASFLWSMLKAYAMGILLDLPLCSLFLLPYWQAEWKLIASGAHRQ